MYRKIKADAIFTGLKMLDGSHVLITEPDGKIADIVPAADAGDDVEFMKGILCPGFVNCHCHIELSYLKGKIPEHTGLVDFVLAVLAGREIDTAIQIEAMEKASRELFETGTVAIGDICNNAASVDLKRNSPLHWINFIEVSGFVNKTADQRFNAAQLVADEFATLPFPYAIVPHAPYSVSENLFQQINDKSKHLISIHNQETSEEDEFFKNKQGGFLKLYDRLGIDISGFSPTGKSSLQSWLRYFTHHQKIISVHNTFVSQADIDFAKDLIYCICINANLYIENKLPPIDMLYKNNCNIVIGTDSYASNHQLNMMEEMKAIQKHFPQLETETILGWATLNGAKALGIPDNYGSFEKGKRPGIILIENVSGTEFTKETKGRRL